MKHSLMISCVMLALFFVSEIAGLAILHEYVDPVATAETGELTYHNLPFDQERPDVAEDKSYIYIIIAVLIGTILALGLIKFKLWNAWKLWFFLAVWIAITISMGAFLGDATAAIIAFFVTLLKVYKPNVIFHNVTEILVYAGIAAILVPVMNIFAAFMLLLFISAYDFYAVFKSKHMVKLAEASNHVDFFAGFSIPYHTEKGLFFKAKKAPKKTAKKQVKDSKIRVAMLGGGDIAFCLLFAGVALKHFSFLQTLIIPLFATAALSYLFFWGDKNKYYPAMPFVSAGCFLGYGLLLLL